MNRVNRCVVVIRPLAPYLEWASKVSDDEFLDEEDAEVLASAYLLPDLEDEDDAEALLARNAATIFEGELSQWHDDRSSWPESRDFDTLLQWFAIDLVPLVMDIAGQDLKTLPLEE
ncbi:MAG: hypothetical protein AAFQ82_01250 [Myxococcota bacterium]